MKYMETAVIVAQKNISGRTAISFVRLMSLQIMNPVYLFKDDREINVHSLLGLLSLGIKEGDEFEIKSRSKEDLEKTKQIINCIWDD